MSNATNETSLYDSINPIVDNVLATIYFTMAVCVLTLNGLEVIHEP